MYIATSLLCVGIFASFALPLIKWHLEDNSKWIYRKSHALKALIHADLDNTDNKPITEHLLEYYKPKKITPKLIRYFEENYPKVLEKERTHRKQAQVKREELEVLFDQFKVIQKTNLKSIKQVQELGTDPENTQERWEQILEYLVEGEINRLTYHGLALPSLEERIGNYYTKEELTEELLDYIENNFIRVLSEKLEKIEESKRPKYHSPYKHGTMTLQEIAEQKALEEKKERELEHSLNALEARQKVQLKTFKEFHTTTPTKQEQL